ncbi:MAG: STAS domain-containing protein [Bacteriovoracia bacterium]
MKYKTINQNNVCILTISGDLTRDDSEILTTCSNEVKSAEAAIVVIFFKNVSVIDPLLFRDLTMLQHDLRKKGKKIYIAGLNVQLKTTLSEKGVIRGGEVFASLNEVLITLSKLN